MKSIPQFLSLLLILGLLGLFITPISVAEEGQAETLPVTVGGDTAYASARAEEEWDPFEDMLQMRARLHQMFDEGFWRAMQAPGQVGSSVQRALKQPAMDIAETPGEIILTLDLPGVTKENIQIEINNNVLAVRGTRSSVFEEEREKQDARYYHRERVSGAFQRYVSLPDTADVTGIQADQKDGILTIRIPKKEEAKPIQVPVS